MLRCGGCELVCGQQYGNLRALNRQWGTDFNSWDAVIPETTRANDAPLGWQFLILGRFQGLDECGVRARQPDGHGCDSLRRPNSSGGDNGRSDSGWGGYDYALLANASTSSSPIDLGGNVDIVRALNPQTRVITTSFGLEPQERIASGVSCFMAVGDSFSGACDKTISHDDGTLDARGRDAAPYFREIRSALARF